jgi:hypothetical protein
MSQSQAAKVILSAQQFRFVFEFPHVFRQVGACLRKGEALSRRAVAQALLPGQEQTPCRVAGRDALTGPERAENSLQDNPGQPILRQADSASGSKKPRAVGPESLVNAVTGEGAPVGKGSGSGQV